MSARLRVVLDQLTQIADPDTASAALDLTRGLLATTPAGCTVEAIVPAGGDVPIDGLADVRTLGLARRELAASWQLGIAPGVGGGMIHAPSLMAPLVRHDRVHDHDQTTVTLWCLDAWEAPETLSKASVSWHRAMLKRAVKHADAIVVPSHAIAERLAELAKLGERIQVVAGAAPGGFAIPVDSRERRAALSLPDRYVVVTGSGDALAEGFRGAVAADAHAVVLDAGDGAEPLVAEIASAAGLPEQRAHVRGRLGADDRAAVLGGAAALAATGAGAAWPWRVLEAMTLGVPIVAVDSGVHHDVVADGGMIVPRSDLADAVATAAGDAARRLSVLAADRARAFSWAGSAERIWALHAEL